MSATPEPQQILLSAPTSEPLDAPTHEDVILYHQMWRALLQGSSNRAALPPELVQYVVAFAGWMLPDYTRTVRATEGVHIRCDDGDETAKVSARWFVCEPLSSSDVNSIAGIQLITLAHDQGWTSLSPPSSFSWFEVGIERQGKPVPQLQWNSHHNELCGSQATLVGGPVIPASRLNIEVGDIIAVSPYAQSLGWSNDAEKGELRFYKLFQPVIPLRLQEQSSGENARALNDY